MAAAPLTIEFLKSKRGKDKATFQGFVYTLTKSSSEVQQWVCEMRGMCKARVHTRGDVIIKPTLLNDIHSSHTHGSDPVRIDMLKGYNKVKERSIDSEESTRIIVSYGIEQMGASSVAQLPKLESVKRTIRTHKSRSEENCGNPTCAAEILVPEKYKVTLKQEPFLLFDSGYGDVNRMIIFASQKFFSLLADSRTWYADGTFKVVPEYFFQLYTIHVEKDGFVYPCVYALLPDKTTSTYNRLLSKLFEIQPALDPSRIMTDFEKAAINVFEEKFLAVISGCFFHLSQNVYRKIQSEGLTAIYQEDREFLIKLKMLPSLAFVPEEDVVDCYNILMTDFPESALNVAVYFEETYIGKRLPDNSRRIPPFPIRIWNIFERVREQLPRTNNAVEGWHNALNSSIGCSHPSVSKLFKCLQREQSLQEANLIKWEAGSTMVRSKKSIERENRIQLLVADYVNRDIQTYLRGIAYNFDF